MPDYLCGVIVDTFKACGVTYQFYRVNRDLTIDYASLGRDVDVLYVIDYFGKNAVVDRDRLPRETVILRDAVFQPPVPPSPESGDWVWFTSLRKFSPLADGSTVVSTLELDPTGIRPGPAPFVSRKLRAKALKDAYLRNRTGSEDDYLALFREGETLLDEQTQVYSMSPESLAMLIDFAAGLAAERKRREANYDNLHRRLGRYAIDLGDAFKTLFVMDVDDRDGLRRHLAEHRIFLPAHWPNTYGLSNPLYDRVLSVPVDSRYVATDLDRVASRIEQYFAGTGTEQS